MTSNDSCVVLPEARGTLTLSLVQAAVIQDALKCLKSKLLEAAASESFRVMMDVYGVAAAVDRRISIIDGLEVDVVRLRVDNKFEGKERGE